MEFPDKVRFVREQLKLSQEDLGRALNMSFATINRWENAKTKPIKVAQAAFDAFCESHGINFEEKKDTN